ncbi:8607_t:CDS:1, partial [Dentiscutata erythropus]
WLSRNSIEWFTTKDSFIFSLKPQNLSNSILSRIIRAKEVIGCYSNHGPVFGTSFYKPNDGKEWICCHQNAYYEKQLRSGESNLLIDEFEVIQILKN